MDESIVKYTQKWLSSILLSMKVQQKDKHEVILISWKSNCTIFLKINEKKEPQKDQKSKFDDSLT